MKIGFSYFFKTQLTIMVLFNFILLLAYIPLILFSLIVFGMLDVNGGSQAYSVVACAVPVIVLFCCGVYYRNAKNYYFSHLVPRFFSYASGKQGLNKKPIIKPKSAIVRYVSAAFPIVYLLLICLFYEQARFNPLILLVNLPYNWIFLTPAWYLVFSETTLNDLFFPVFLPLAAYVFFFVGYLTGNLRVFDRFFRDKKKRVTSDNG